MHSTHSSMNGTAAPQSGLEGRQGLGGLFPEIMRGADRPISPAGSGQSGVPMTPGTAQRRSRTTYECGPMVVNRSYTTSRFLGTFTDPDAEADYIMFTQAHYGPLVWSALVCAAIGIAYAVSRLVAPFRSNLGVQDSSLAPVHIVMSLLWLSLAGTRYYASITGGNRAAQQQQQQAPAPGSGSVPQLKRSTASDTSSNRDADNDEDTACPDCLSAGSVTFEYLAAVLLTLHCMLWAATLVASTQEVQCYDANLGSPSFSGATSSLTASTGLGNNNACTRGSPPFDNGFLPIFLMAFKIRFPVAVPMVFVYFAFMIGTGLSASTVSDVSAQGSIAVLSIFESAVSLLLVYCRDREARQQFVRRKEHAEQLVISRHTVAAIHLVAASVLPPALKSSPFLGLDTKPFDTFKSDVASVVVAKLSQLDKSVTSGTIGELREALSLKNTLLQNIEQIARIARVTRVGFIGDQLWAASNLSELSAAASLADLNPEMKSRCTRDAVLQICHFTRRVETVVGQLCKMRPTDAPVPLWDEVKFKAGIDVGEVRGIVPSNCGPPVLHINGRTVRIANRICDIAPAGTIYLTETARNSARQAYTTHMGSRVKVEGDFTTLYALGTPFKDDSITSSTYIMSSMNSNPQRSYTINSEHGGSIDGQSRQQKINVLSGVPRLYGSTAEPMSPVQRSTTSSQSSAGRYQVVNEEPIVLLTEEGGNPSNSSSFSRAEKTDEVELRTFLGELGKSTSPALTLDGSPLLGYQFSDPTVEAEYRSSGSLTCDMAVTFLPVTLLGITCLIQFAALGSQTISWKTGIVVTCLIVVPFVAYLVLRARKINLVAQTSLRWIVFTLTVCALWGCNTWNDDLKNMLRVNVVFVLTVALASRVSTFLPTTFPLVLDFAIANIAMQACEYVSTGAIHSVSARVYELITKVMLYTVAARASDLHSRRARLGVEETRMAVSRYDAIKVVATINTSRLLPRRMSDIVCARGIIGPNDVLYAPAAIVLVIIVKPTSVVSLTTSPTSKPQDGSFGHVLNSMYGRPPETPESQQEHAMTSRNPSTIKPPPSRTETVAPPPGTAGTNHRSLRGIDSDISFGKKSSQYTAVSADTEGTMVKVHTRRMGGHHAQGAFVDSVDDINALLEDDAATDNGTSVPRVHVHGGRGTRAGSVSEGSVLEGAIVLEESIHSHAGGQSTRPPTIRTALSQSPAFKPVDTVELTPGGSRMLQVPPLKTELTLTPEEEETLMLVISSHLEDSNLVRSGAAFVTRGVDSFIVIGNFNSAADAECDGMELLGLGQGICDLTQVREYSYSVRGGLCTGTVAGAFIGATHRAFDVMGPALARATSLAREAPDTTFFSAPNPNGPARAHFLHSNMSRSVSTMSSISMQNGDFLL